MMPFAPHRRARTRVGLEHPTTGSDVPPLGTDVPLAGEAGAAGLSIQFVAVRPEEELVPGESFLVVVRSPEGRARSLLAAVADTAAIMVSHEPEVSADGLQAAQVFTVVLPTLGVVVSETIREAASGSDGWVILRSDYGHVFEQVPQIVGFAAGQTAGALASLAAELGRFAGKAVKAAGEGLGVGTVALALGAAAGGLLLYAWARGK